jgi:PKHD-type hydroxylase
MSSKYFIQNQRNDVNHFNYYYFTNVFSNEELNLIKSIGESLPITKAKTVGEDGFLNESSYRKSEVSWIPENDDHLWLYNKISTYADMANKEMRWNFDIWGYQDILQYTVYHGDGGHYDWHVDMGPGISNRKMSVVIQLSDPNEYEGGELQINPGGNIMTVPKQLGLICFFPSFLLHRVTPLTSGTRRSLVTWLCGANFR